MEQRLTGIKYQLDLYNQKILLFWQKLDVTSLLLFTNLQLFFHSGFKVILTFGGTGYIQCLCIFSIILNSYRNPVFPGAR